jgi:hypothetical protein
MDTQNEQLNQLKEIRSLMERSSRFLSLSGLAGISAGIVALLGAAAAFFLLDFDERYFDNYQYFFNLEIGYTKFASFLLADGIVMLFLALSLSLFFTIRKARKNGFPIWDNTTRRLLINLAIPLATGGLFCIALLLHRLVFLIAPATLIFYGLGLIFASHYTLKELRYLGLSEIFLGLISSVLVGYGLVFWALGFGVLHIIYGWQMYHKYEQ